jgi:hypothetical protein
MMMTMMIIMMVIMIMMVMLIENSGVTMIRLRVPR